MLKKMIIKNQTGFSLAALMMALSVIAAGTYYIMDANRKSKIQSARARSVNIIEMEKNRIASYLSDTNNCKNVLLNRVANLKDPRWPNHPEQPYTTLYTDNTNTEKFLTNDPSINPSTGKGYNNYYNDRLVLTFINTYFTVGQANSGRLELEYNQADLSKNIYIGKANAIISIDMHMTVVGGLITECYAISQSQKIKDAITASCSTTPANSIVYYNTVDTVIDSCHYDLDLPSAATNYSCGAGKAFSKIERSPKAGSSTGYSMLVQASACSGFDGVCTAGGMNRAKKITNSTLTCYEPGMDSTQDPQASCSNGTFPVKTGTASVTCMGIDCGGTDLFIKKLSGAGASCVQAPISTCAAGEYIRGWFSDGSKDCAPMPSLAGDCSPGFGTSFSRNIGTYNGTINCSPYNKAKPCGGTQTTFLSQLNGSGSPVCTTY